MPLVFSYGVAVGGDRNREESRLDWSTDTLVFWALAAVALTVSIVIDNESFERFYGPISPVVVTIVAAIVGSISLRILRDRGWLGTGARPANFLRRSGFAGMAFALLAAAFDSVIHFPEEMNVAWPRSVLFYPAIAFVAEVAFHIAPLAVLIVILGWRFTSERDARRVWITIAVVTVVETLFQTLDALGGEDKRLAFFVAPQLAAVGAFQLMTFRRYGLAALVSFRLGYYLVWHIIWGHVRLTVLF